MTSVLLFLSAFLASGVEFVEALTIVLALGTARGWRSPLVGAGAAALALAALVAALGPALVLVPIDALRLVVGAVLLPFGLQWLRKAILRASGYVAIHDEEEAFRRQSDAARRSGVEGEAGLDWYAFTLSFKGVLLEGLEVAFIVITFGSSERNLPLAALAGGTALVLVVAAGAALRAPLTRIPENTIKFTVGILLTTFGIFWGAEGTGVSWPGDDFALLGVLAFVSLSAFVLVRVLRARRAPIPAEAL
ncbi:MAG TPA: hypothetical protein VE693_05460 [Gaiellaceae bacterium]|nr:hypothetical protein [Gaiellaceae bacterium]